MICVNASAHGNSIVLPVLPDARGKRRPRPRRVRLGGWHLLFGRAPRWERSAVVPSYVARVGQWHASVAYYPRDGWVARIVPEGSPYAVTYLLARTKQGARRAAARAIAKARITRAAAEGYQVPLFGMLFAHGSP